MKRSLAPVVKRVTVTVPAFDSLSRRIVQAATAKPGVECETANRLLEEALRKTPIRARSAEHMRLLADSRDGKLSLRNGRPCKNDDRDRTICRVFDALCRALPDESGRAIVRRLVSIRWPISGAIDLDGDAGPQGFESLEFENLKKIIQRGKVGTKPV